MRRLGGEDLVGAHQHRRKPLAHMPDDELELWMPVERAGEDEAEDMNSDFGVPAPRRR